MGFSLFRKFQKLDNTNNSTSDKLCHSTFSRFRMNSASNLKTEEHWQEYHIHTWTNFSQIIYCDGSFCNLHCYHMKTELKPQDSYGEIEEKKFLIFRQCRKSSESTIRPSCNCLEWHIVMQYCPMVNYHYVYTYMAKCSGRLRTFIYFGYFLKMEAFSERTVNRALIVHTTL